MKKLFLIPILLASLFLCACQSTDTEDYTSQLRLNISHIDESDNDKEVHISYPVFGGIENKEVITIINTSISNFVNSQYEEFQNALTTAEQEELSDTDTILNTVGNTDLTSNQTDTSNDNNISEDTDNETTDEESGSGSDNGNDGEDEEEKDTDKTSTKNKETITLSMGFKITYNKNNYICIVQTYEKNLGENKHFNGQRSFLFSLENATYLTLEEIFTFDEDFTTYVNNKIKEELKNGAYTSYEDTSGFTGVSKNSKFYIDNNNLYIYYDTLEISPDKDAIPTFAFKLSDMKKYLTEDSSNLF